MRKIVIVILFVINLTNAQDKIPFIDYAEIQLQIAESSKKKDHTKTLELINKINKNDSMYFPLLTTKPYYLLQLKRFEEAIKVADEGIKSNYKNSKVFFYINKGVALTNLKKHDLALENYNDGIKKYPKNYVLWFNKAVVLESKGLLNDAIIAYQEAITLNPLNRKPHLQMGTIFYKQNRISQALMCYNIYILLDPNSQGAFTILEKLENIISTNTLIKKNDELEAINEENYFKDIDALISSRVALNENYTTNNPINSAITRQNHLLILQLSTIDENSSFWHQKYVAFYKWIVKSNQFDNFAYTLSISTQNEANKKVIESKSDAILQFFKLFKNKWIEIVSKNIINFNGETQEVFYQYDDATLKGIGQKKDNKMFGVWQFYDAYGKLKTKGSFNENEEKTGKWLWYNHLNKIKEIATYKNGNLEGENSMNYDNGKKYIDANFINNNLSGKYDFYETNGALSERKYFKDGLLDGEYKSYFKVGKELLEFKIPYEKDLIEGEALEYYADGSIYSKSNYINGVLSGKKTNYYFNQKESSEINYKNGALNGSYKTYHSNGQVFEEGQAVKAFYEGTWKTYYASGVLQSEFDYKKGKLNNVYVFYDTDGKMHYDHLYENGNIIAYTYYKKDGEVLSTGFKKDTILNFKGYSANGNLTSQGLYNNSGSKVGEWKFYSDNGVLKSKGSFEKKRKNGNFYDYHKNGNVASISPYVNDVLEGYYTSNYKNKQLSAQGWYKAGNNHGEWRHYYKDGTLQAINFYHKSQLRLESVINLHNKLEFLYFYYVLLGSQITACL